MKAKSLAEQLKKVKLPKVAFHLDDNDRITMLTDLEMKESTKKSCDCSVVVGSEVVAEGDLTHINKIEAALSDCFPSLKEAKEALRLQVMRRDKAKYARSLPKYHDSVSHQIKFLKNHPDLVLQYLKQNEDVDENLTVETLNRDHYRLCCRGDTTVIRDIIINKKFPELAKEDEDEDD